MSRGVFAHIDLASLQHNLTQVRALVGCESKILAMVKANAYGHGLVAVAKALGAADGFGVATLDEAIQLRQNGILHPIVLMQGVHDEEELALAQQSRLIPVLHDDHQLSVLRSYRFTAQLDVWLKLETGMHRLGYPKKALREVHEELVQHPYIRDGFVLATHLARADDHEVMTREQLVCFSEATSTFTNSKSVCNSAAILAYPSAHLDWVRPGIMLYGVSPFAGQLGRDFNLKPVMRFCARVISIKGVKRGQAIGYGGGYVCKENKTIAVVNVGYGDGYPRTVKQSVGEVMIRGERCAILGKVSMDMLTVDVSHLPEAEVMDEVTLWGDGLPVEKVAEAAQTIPYDLVTRVTMRVPYQYH